MHNLEIFCAAKFQQVEIYINNRKVAQAVSCYDLTCEICEVPARIEIFFHPFQIKPFTRIDGFLLDSWLADIRVYDHKIDLEFDEGFFERYKRKNIQGRLAALSKEQQQTEHFLDKYVGVDNLHPELLQQIRQFLDQ